MNSAVVERTTITLEERLKNGAELLFEMEAREHKGPNYQRWLDAWLDLLARYESSSATS